MVAAVLRRVSPTGEWTESLVADAAESGGSPSATPSAVGGSDVG